MSNDSIWKRFSNNVKNFSVALYGEQKARIAKEHAQVRSNEPGGEQLRGVDFEGGVKGRVLTNNSLVINYSGQAFWNTEFGKGEGTGIPALSGATVLQTNFLSSRLFRSHFRNPRRNKGYKEKVYTDERTQPYPVHVTNKKGTHFTRYITRRKYVMREPKIKDALLRIYSRPDGYIDLDGVYHDSNARGEFWVEKPVKRGEQRPPLSMKGAFSLQRFWGYDFAQGKVINNNLQKTKAYKEFEENLITDIEEYLFGK